MNRGSGPYMWTKGRLGFCGWKIYGQGPWNMAKSTFSASMPACPGAKWSVFGEDVKAKIGTKTTIIRQVQLRFRPSPMPSQSQVLRKKDVKKDEVSTGFCVLLWWVDQLKGTDFVDGAVTIAANGSPAAQAWLFRLAIDRFCGQPLADRVRTLWIDRMVVVLTPMQWHPLCKKLRWLSESNELCGIVWVGVLTL